MKFLEEVNVLPRESGKILNFDIGNSRDVVSRTSILMRAWGLLKAITATVLETLYDANTETEIMWS